MAKKKEVSVLQKVRWGLGLDVPSDLLEKLGYNESRYNERIKQRNLAEQKLKFHWEEISSSCVRWVKEELDVKKLLPMFSEAMRLYREFYDTFPAPIFELDHIEKFDPEWYYQRLADTNFMYVNAVAAKWGVDVVIGLGNSKNPGSFLLSKRNELGDLPEAIELAGRLSFSASIFLGKYWKCYVCDSWQELGSESTYACNECLEGRTASPKVEFLPDPTQLDFLFGMAKIENIATALKKIGDALHYNCPGDRVLQFLCSKLWRSSSGLVSFADALVAYGHGDIGHQLRRSSAYLPYIWTGDWCHELPFLEDRDFFNNLEVSDLKTVREYLLCTAELLINSKDRLKNELRNYKYYATVIDTFEKKYPNYWQGVELQNSEPLIEKNLNPGQIRILKFCRANESLVTARTAADNIPGMSEPNATKILRQLEAAGFLYKPAGSNSGRAPTPEGIAYLEKYGNSP